MKYAIPILILSAGLLFSCNKSSTTTYDCSGANPTYTQDIKSILDANCATSGCHNSSSQAHGINLSTYSEVVTESGKARFMGSIEHQSGYAAMPENKPKLSDADIQSIYCWIQNGKQE